MRVALSFTRSFAKMYTPSHEWVELIAGKNAKVGITFYAQSHLGDLVHVELPKVGDSFKKGQPFADMESVKAAAQVYSPVSLKVVKCNEEVSNNPAIVNKSAEKQGWMIEGEVENVKDIDSLMDKAAYAEHMAKEAKEEAKD